MKYLTFGTYIRLYKLHHPLILNEAGASVLQTNSITVKPMFKLCYNLKVTLVIEESQPMRKVLEKFPISQFYSMGNKKIIVEEILVTL